MKPRSMATAIILTALMILPQIASAVPVHNFACAKCHISGLTLTQIASPGAGGTGNVCLSCHDKTITTNTNDGTAAVVNVALVGADASNAFGNNSGATRQTSHNWAAPDKNSLAGAEPPTDSRFYTSNGSSHGKVTCSRCHNPHADRANPQLLTTGPGTSDSMCLDCHRTWNQGSAMSNITHPVGVAYNAASLDPQKYRLAPVQVYNSTVMLVDNKIVCRTCHLVHYADSDAKTIDGYANWNNLSAGDGKLLRSWGRVDSANNTPSAIYNSAVMSSALCTTCHIYDTHEGGHATLGCLDCHSSHSPAGNYYMLRPKVEGIYVPKLGIFYNSSTLIYNSMTSPWKAPDGKGYCEGCHNIPLSVAQHNVATAGKAECGSCHNHANNSFTSACNSCHGYAPSTNTAGGTTGYAVTTTAPLYNYSNSGVFKDESLTPHKRHANGSGNYSFSCNQCHYTVVGIATAPHMNGNFQDVGFTDVGIIAKTDGATPAYTPTGNGSCATTYCHSNGGPRSNGAMKYPTSAPVWATGAGDITTCNACHGNSEATMSATDRNNSATHAKHLAKGYTCAACHSQTATGNTTLVTAGGDHVDGQADVFYKNDYSLGAANLGVGSYNNTDGTCGIYCHSNGTTRVTPDWDLPATGACGTCHKYNANADATQDGTGPALGGAHNAHVFDVDGPKLACTICHTNNGTGADHVNGARSMVANMQTSVCNPCHGSSAGVTTGNDREPVWANAASVDCATCHIGVLATINTRTAPAKNSFYTLGHGDPTLAAGSPNCIGCHTLTADHIDGVTDSNMLTGGATANDAYCKTCHALNSHYGNSKTAGGTSSDGLACATCHEPHGDGMGTNTDVMLLGTIATRTVNNFTDKTARASYWKADNTGICQVCHDPAEVSYFNRTTANDAGHNPGPVCTQCHKHNSTPVAFAASCTDCHGNTVNGNYWPDSNTYGVDNGTAWPNRLGSHDIHITKIAKVKYATATPTVSQKNATCDYCHPGGSHSGDQGAAPADLMNGTTGKFKNILGAVNVQTSTVTQLAGNISCSNVDCHYKAATSATDWYTAGSQANCSYCHTVADAPYVAGTLPDAHNKHMNEFANVGRNLVCIDCHASAGTDNAHQNGVVDFSTAVAPLESTLSINAAKTSGTKLGPKYGLSAVATEFANCASLYCHSTGQSTYTAVTVNWASITVDCTSCHKGAATDTTLTGAHKAHTFSGAITIGRNLTCNECHSATASGNATISDASKHVDKTRDLLVPNFGTPQLTCATVYCHSNGNYDGTLTYNSATLKWTVANSYNCTTCHGDGAGKAYPSYPNGGPGINANSHEKHIAGSGASCGNCHKGTSKIGTAIDGTVPTEHVNKVVNVYNTATIAGGYSDLTDTCSSISCHGGNSAVWGDTLGCRACHGNATSDTDDFSYKNGVLSKVAFDEWTYSGHGKPATATYDITGRFGADFDKNGATTIDGCLYCHDGSVGHGAANLFRLRQNGKADLNGACLGCHATGSAGVDPDGAGTVYASKNSTVKVDKYHGGAKHNGTDRDAGRWCWDCHDPHGDAEVAGLRIQMIQRRPHQNPDANGVPAALATTDVVFTNNTTGAAVGSFAMNAAPFAQGVCNSCHTTTAQYTQTAGAGSHPTSDCTVCHAHSGDTAYDGNAFKGSGCNGCHGNSTVGNYWPDGNAAALMPTANSAGRHAKHMEILASRVYTEQYNTVLLTNTANGTADFKQRTLCAFCHNTPGSDADHGVLANLPADVNGMKNLWSPYDADTASYSSNQHGQLGNDTCASVNCHNNKLTTDNTYGWYDAGASACIMCHSNAPAEQTHAQHLTGSIYGLASSCAYCHDAATNWSTNTKPASNHINGVFNVSGSVALTYSGTYPTAKGSCGTNACHNNGRNGAPVSGVYTWGTTTNATCSFCHSPALGHTPHIAGSGTFFSGGASCTWCHPYNGTASNVDHMNANINVLAAMNYSGTNLGVAQTASYGTCSTTVCHQDGNGIAVATPAWNVAWTGQACDLCHFNGSAAKAKTASHGAHVGSVSYNDYTAAAANNSIIGEYRYNCAKCHGNTLSNHLNSTNWTAPTVNVDVGVNFSADSCSSNACHNNGTGGAAIRTAYWSAVNWGVGDDSDKCNNCHGNSPTSSAHQVHAVGIHATDIYSGGTGLLTTATATKAHGDAATSTTINCNICHNSVVTMARNKFGSECISCHTGNPSDATNVMTVADKSKHVDGTKQVVFASSLSTGGFKSKAQLRDDITTVTSLNASWTRSGTYKAAAGYDAAKAAAPAYTGGSCSAIDCHNGITATWAAPANNCMACHTGLPK